LTRKVTLFTLLIPLVLAATACSMDPPPPPELTPQVIFNLIGEKWSREELSHFTVTFHSDTLVECGVRNDMWKLTEMTDRAGTAWSAAYQLTDKGKTMVSAVDLKESGRGHAVTLRGPYHVELLSIVDGAQPNAKLVAFKWSLDWDKAAPEMKTCMPQFELAGKQIAQFELAEMNWRFVTYVRPEDVPAGPAGSILDKLR
jgi:hypothetical protein